MGKRNLKIIWGIILVLILGFVIRKTQNIQLTQQESEESELLPLTLQDKMDLEVLSQYGDALMSIQETIDLLGRGDDSEGFEAGIAKFRMMNQYQKEVVLCYLLGQIVELAS